MNRLIYTLTILVLTVAAADQPVTVRWYTFETHAAIEETRRHGNWFLEGANSTYYAPNATYCFNNALSLVQYDIDLLAVKWFYGTAMENVLNATLFARNVSDVAYECVDAAENLFVWSMFKFETFGRKWNNVMLAGIQNILGRVLTIQRVYNQIV